MKFGMMAVLAAVGMGADMVYGSPSKLADPQPRYQSDEEVAEALKKAQDKRDRKAAKRLGNKTV